jgi:hypothetical protein
MKRKSKKMNMATKIDISFNIEVSINWPGAENEVMSRASISVVHNKIKASNKQK